MLECRPGSRWSATSRRRRVAWSTGETRSGIRVEAGDIAALFVDDCGPVDRPDAVIEAVSDATRSERPAPRYHDRRESHTNVLAWALAYGS